MQSHHRVSGCEKPTPLARFSFLPQFLDFDDVEWPLSIEADPFKTNRTWWVFYAPSSHTESGELIDAIFDMIVELKEEGVI